MDPEHIDLVVADWFVGEFLDQEVATRRAYLGAPDGDEAHAAWRALGEWFREIEQPLVPMPWGPRSEQWLRANADELARQRRRVPFFLRRVDAGGRPLVDVWASDDGGPQDGVRVSILLADFDGDLRVIGLRWACPSCWTSGRQAHAACPECEGTGFVRATGAALLPHTVLDSQQLGQVRFVGQLFLNQGD